MGQGKSQGPAGASARIVLRLYLGDVCILRCLGTGSSASCFYLAIKQNLLGVSQNRKTDKIQESILNWRD
jgi:hypothetical protein